MSADGRQRRGIDVVVVVSLSIYGGVALAALAIGVSSLGRVASKADFLLALAALSPICVVVWFLAAMTLAEILRGRGIE